MYSRTIIHAQSVEVCHEGIIHFPLTTIVVSAPGSAPNKKTSAYPDNSESCRIYYVVYSRSCQNVPQTIHCMEWASTEGGGGRFSTRSMAWIHGHPVLLVTRRDNGIPSVYIEEHNIP